MIPVKQPNSMSIDPLTSPCVRMCTLDDANVCLGCYRTIDEICAWSQASLDERRGILARAIHRREEMRR